MNQTVMVVAGEASGDQHGAALVRECKRLDPTLRFTGIGGDNMRAAGVDTIVDVSELAVMGFVEVIAHLPTIYRTFKKIERVLKTNPPALLILVDYPGFNLRLAKVAKQLGIKVLFYISPQVWAWRRGRVKRIAQVVDHLAVIFPFEVDCYRETDLPVTYVGHPLTHQVKVTIEKPEFLKTHQLDTTKKIVALLPGSRKGELMRLLPTMLISAEQLAHNHADLQFVVLQAATIDDAYLSEFLAHTKLPITVVKNDSYNTMNAADVLIAASGTVTLEAAILTKPMVVVYKAAALTAMIARRLVKIENVSLCNIVAGKRIVEELLQEAATPENICRETAKILYDNAYREQMIQELVAVREKLGHEDGSKNTAKLALKMLNA